MSDLINHFNAIVIDLLNTDFYLVFTNIYEAFYVTYKYEYSLVEYIIYSKKYSEVNIFKDDSWARVQLYSLSLIDKLYDKPHYRSKSFQQDMIDNLRNVTIPGIGIPCHLFVYNKYLIYLLLFIINPIICFIGSIVTLVIVLYNNKKCSNINNKSSHPNNSSNHKNGNKKTTYNTYDEIDISYEWVSIEYFMITACQLYIKYLIHPSDWFSFWRLNCRLISYHSNITNAIGYKQEDKWTFLTDGKELDVPISPYLQIESIVCKNKNIEGGMGIFFYKNAAHGGDWIIQETLNNCDWLKALLPINAPLSTMRIITSSIYPRSNNPSFNSTSDSIIDKEIINSLDVKKYIKPLSAVLRLGRSGAATDHSSIFYNVDLSTHKITHGSTNYHWYQIGIYKNLLALWSSKLGLGYNDKYDIHPDPPHPQVVGKFVPDMEKAIDIVVNSHYKMMKDVPLVGWDVAFTTKGIYLLEVNLSCNFFQGKFDIPSYIDFVNDYFNDLQIIEEKKLENK